MDFDNFEIDESAIQDADKRREAQLQEDEKPVEVDAEECEACNI